MTCTTQNLSTMSVRRAQRRAIFAAALLATAAASPTYGQSVGSFTNDGFETGDTTGWTTCGSKWYTGNWPLSEADCTGPATLATIQTAGTTDPNTGVPTVFAGNYSLLLNDRSNNYDITGASQVVTNYTGNKIYYAWNAVLEPSHGATDSPSFVIKLTDLTTGTVVENIAYSAYTAQNTTLFHAAGFYVTADWKVEDIDVISGHDYKLLVLAADCAHGGHTGYVYVDGFGNVIPTNNGDVTFSAATDLTKGASFLIPISGTPDIDTAQPFYTTSQLAANAVNPNFVGGTLEVDSAGPVTTAFTVQSQGGSIDTNGNNIEFSGAFTGVGGLAKLGAGILTLSGTSAINGSVDVNAGTLTVKAPLSLASLNVNNGGTLTGDGTIVGNVAVASGGVLSPGDEIGKLDVAGGNVTLATGATFRTDIDGATYSAAGGAGSYDRLVLSLAESTFNAGGTISPVLRGITGGNNTFAPVLGDRFTVVTADAVSGEFVSVLQPTAGMPANRRFDVIYNAKDVQLVLTPGSFAGQGAGDGWKLNGIAAAAGLDAVRPTAGTRSGALQSLFNNLYGMTAPQYRLAFQQLSGEIHANALQLADLGSRDTGGLALDAARSWVGGGDSNCGSATGEKVAGSARQEAAACADPERNRPALWTRLIAQHTAMDGDGIASGYSGNRTGFAAGVHLVNNHATRFGFGGGYSENNVDSPIGGSAHLAQYSLFAYASHDIGALNLSGMLGFSSADVSSRRTMNLLSGAPVATSNHTVETFHGVVEARYTKPLGRNVTLRPVLGLSFSQNSAGGIVENAADANTALSLPAQDWNTVDSKVGLETEMALAGKIRCVVFGNWLHRLSGASAAERAVTLGNASWVAKTGLVTEESFEFGAGLSAQLKPNVKLTLDYRGIRDNGSLSTDRGSIGLALAF